MKYNIIMSLAATTILFSGCGSDNVQKYLENQVQITDSNITEDSNTTEDNKTIASSSSSSSSSNIELQELKGYVRDGIIYPATVCLDLNKNSFCDIEEPSTNVNITGEFNLSTIHIPTNQYITLSYGKSISSGKDNIKTIMSPIYKGKESSIYISNISDMISHKMLNNLSEKSATRAVAWTIGVKADDIYGDSNNPVLLDYSTKLNYLIDVMLIFSEKYYTEHNIPFNKQSKIIEYKKHISNYFNGDNKEFGRFVTMLNLSTITELAENDSNIKSLVIESLWNIKVNKESELNDIIFNLNEKENYIKELVTNDISFKENSEFIINSLNNIYTSDSDENRRSYNILDYETDVINEYSYSDYNTLNSQTYDIENNYENLNLLVNNYNSYYTNAFKDYKSALYNKHYYNSMFNKEKAIDPIYLDLFSFSANNNILYITEYDFYSKNSGNIIYTEYDSDYNIISNRNNNKIELGNDSWIYNNYRDSFNYNYTDNIIGIDTDYTFNNFQFNSLKCEDVSGKSITGLNSSVFNVDSVACYSSGFKKEKTHYNLNHIIKESVFDSDKYFYTINDLFNTYKSSKSAYLYSLPDISHNNLSKYTLNGDLTQKSGVISKYDYSTIYHLDEHRPTPTQVKNFISSGKLFSIDTDGNEYQLTLSNNDFGLVDDQNNTILQGYINIKKNNKNYLSAYWAENLNYTSSNTVKTFIDIYTRDDSNSSNITYTKSGYIPMYRKINNEEMFVYFGGKYQYITTNEQSYNNYKSLYKDDYNSAILNNKNMIFTETEVGKWKYEDIRGVSILQIKIKDKEDIFYSIYEGKLYSGSSYNSNGFSFNDVIFNKEGIESIKDYYRTQSKNYSTDEDIKYNNNYFSEDTTIKSYYNNYPHNNNSVEFNSLENTIIHIVNKNQLIVLDFKTKNELDYTINSVNTLKNQNYSYQLNVPELDGNKHSVINVDNKVVLDFYEIDKIYTGKTVSINGTDFTISNIYKY